MTGRSTLAALVALLLASWTSCAAALDRQGAIDVAKRLVKHKCKTVTLCTYNAKLENNKWYVRVDFTNGDSPQDKPASKSGGHAIYIIDQSGKVVGRIESE